MAEKGDTIVAEAGGRGDEVRVDSVDVRYPDLSFDVETARQEVFSWGCESF